VRTAFWESVVQGGCRVPDDAPLQELTAELVTMLGDPDQHVRDDLAAGVLSAWVADGTYDELLPGLGDGLVHALRQGIGEDGTGSVLRRSWSALVLTAMVGRDADVHVLLPQQVLAWADRAVAWFLAERDLRGWDPGLHRVGAVAHGADLLATLAASRHLQADELHVLLDVIAERLLLPTSYRWLRGEDDRLALATMSVLHRDLVAADACEAVLDRLGAAFADDSDPHAPVPSNVSAYLRALHLQLLLGVDRAPSQAHGPDPARHPQVRGDVLLALQDLLRRSAPHVLRRV
jgi:Protein of unknown function (DUF2785)